MSPIRCKRLYGMPVLSCGYTQYIVKGELFVICVIYVTFHETKISKKKMTVYYMVHLHLVVKVKRDGESIGLLSDV
jgi:hypothetical protein